MTPQAAADSFQAMGSEARLKVLRALLRAGEEGLSVGAVQERTGIAASTLSHHIRVLAEAGVIRQKRAGRTVHTSADFDALRDLAAYILAECCLDATDGARHTEDAEARV